MNTAALETFREIAYAMRAGEPQDWQWIGEHMSQRMFGITETQATTFAQRHGGVARRMPILPPAAAPDATPAPAPTVPNVAAHAGEPCSSRTQQ